MKTIEEARKAYIRYELSSTPQGQARAWFTYSQIEDGLVERTFDKEIQELYVALIYHSAALGALNRGRS